MGGQSCFIQNLSDWAHLFNETRLAQQECTAFCVTPVTLQFMHFFSGLEGQTKQTETKATLQTLTMPELWKDWVLPQWVITYKLSWLLQTRFLLSSRSISLRVQWSDTPTATFQSHSHQFTDALLVAWPWRVTIQNFFHLFFFHLKCQHLKVNRGRANCFPNDWSALWINAAT